MYLGQFTRCGILYGVNQLARAMQNPSNAHMEAAKHVLRYLADTVNSDITYMKGVLP